MTKTEERVVEALRGGDKIMRTFINEPPSEAGTFYRLMLAQRTVRKDVVAKLMESGTIRECSDGLPLGEAVGQTYELVTP